MTWLRIEILRNEMLNLVEVLLGALRGFSSENQPVIARAGDRKEFERREQVFDAFVWPDLPKNRIAFSRSSRPIRLFASAGVSSVSGKASFIGYRITVTASPGTPGNPRRAPPSFFACGRKCGRKGCTAFSA